MMDNNGDKNLNRAFFYLYNVSMSILGNPTNLCWFPNVKCKKLSCSKCNISVYQNNIS